MNFIKLEVAFLYYQTVFHQVCKYIKNKAAEASSCLTLVIKKEDCELKRITDNFNDNILFTETCK